MELMIGTSFLTWMEWTVPTAVFFIIIFLMLVAMTIWQTLAPSVERRGFLPIPTTPGDRLFIGLLSSGYIFLAWVGLTNASLWFLLIILVCWLGIVMRWG
jgi:predicted small integral membrane protein